MPGIVHRMVGEFHVLTSPDVSGLYVADRDREVAESRVQPSIDALGRMRDRKANEMRLRAVAVPCPPYRGGP